MQKPEFDKRIIFKGGLLLIFILIFLAACEMDDIDVEGVSTWTPIPSSTVACNPSSYLSTPFPYQTLVPIPSVIITPGFGGIATQNTFREQQTAQAATAAALEYQYSCQVEYWNSGIELTATSWAETEIANFGSSTPEFHTPLASFTPNSTQTLQAAFDEIDKQFTNLSIGQIAFSKPEEMKIEDTTTVELILNPSVPESILATQLVTQSGFITSTADVNNLMAPSGESVRIETSQIEITPRMKAVLLAQEPDAFIIQEMHDNAEQVVSSVNTTTWRWTVTAQKEGSQTLELIIYQLVKYDDKEFWHEVETYKSSIVVYVTVSDRIKSLDWKWIASAILIPLIAVIWNWIRNKNSDEGKTKQSNKKSRKK
jgi:hypothetical protein